MSDADPAELYRALLVSGRLPSLRRLTYRCAEHRCQLLDAIETPLGIIVHRTRHKLSPVVNAQSSTPGMRSTQTVDSNRHWKPSTKFLGNTPLSVDAAMWELLGLSRTDLAFIDLTCDHLLSRLTGPEFWADWDARHAGEVRVRRDGSRYAVT